MNSSTIPIFPLSLVVYPESKYPLHIFEEKYKRMIHRCRSNGEGFGIVAQIGTELSKVGSFVRVADILTEYENGKSDIVVQGINRFILLEHHLHLDGYYEAQVDNFRDLKDIIINQNSIEELKKKFEDIIVKVNFKLEASFWDNIQIQRISHTKLLKNQVYHWNNSRTYWLFAMKMKESDFLIHTWKTLKDR